MEKQIKIGDKTFNIKEFSYVEFMETDFKILKNWEERQKLFELSGIDKETFKTLTISEVKILSKEIEELNGLGQDFQKTSLDDKEVSKSS